MASRDRVVDVVDSVLAADDGAAVQGGQPPCGRARPLALAEARGGLEAGASHPLPLHDHGDDVDGARREGGRDAVEQERTPQCVQLKVQMALDAGEFAEAAGPRERRAVGVGDRGARGGGGGSAGAGDDHPGDHTGEEPPVGDTQITHFTHNT